MNENPGMHSAKNIPVKFNRLIFRRRATLQKKFAYKP